MIRLLHLSDLHFQAARHPLSKLLGQGNKSLLGYLNLKFNRARAFPSPLRETILAKAQNLDWDFACLSGDLTNLSLEEEFTVAQSALSPLAKKGPLLLCAGNHDRYTPSASGRIERFFKHAWPYDQTTPLPFTRELGEGWWMLHLDQAIARGWTSSQGRLSIPLTLLQNTLEKQKGKKWIVLGHYPLFLPPGVKESSKHRIEQMEAIGEILLKEGVRLYLHGHLHQSWCFNPREGVALQAVNSGGCCRFERGSKAGFHLIELSQTAQVRRITLEGVIP